uniref:Emerin n=1 Tax=Mus musculus TaxID=10090 RepID=D6RFS0_MOUSE
MDDYAVLSDTELAAVLRQFHSQALRKENLRVRDPEKETLTPQLVIFFILLSVLRLGFSRRGLRHV